MRSENLKYLLIYNTDFHKIF